MAICNLCHQDHNGKGYTCERCIEGITFSRKASPPTPTPPESGVEPASDDGLAEVLGTVLESLQSSWTPESNYHQCVSTRPGCLSAGKQSECLHCINARIESEIEKRKAADERAAKLEAALQEAQGYLYGSCQRHQGSMTKLGDRIAALLTPAIGGAGKDGG